MKKVLLATTAVALSAGVAYAEVSISGNARMGLQYINPAVGASTTTIEKRMTVDINATTESSSGITFGATMRLRSEENIATFAAGARVFLQTSGFELAMGNINGAIESMPGLYDPSVGLTGLGWGGMVTQVVGADLLSGPADTDGHKYFAWDAYSSTGNGAEGVEVTYTAGAFSGHVSYSDGTANGLSGSGNGIKRAAAYGAYTMNDWTVALGVQESNQVNEDKTILTVGGKIGDYSVGFGYADNEGVNKFALNGSATFGATTVSAYVADEDTAGTDTSYGLGVSYDLGGASIVGGIAHTELGADRADLGVSFSF